MNRKNLTAAVLAGLAGVAGIAGTAQAVNINPDGIGQLLLYPYYTINGDNFTLLSIVNTTEDAKAVKVRFLESENSVEVLDFNLYMSAYDVWTASIEPQPDGRMDDSCDPNPGDDIDVYCTGPVLVVNADENTCMVPSFPKIQSFLPFAYAGDGGSQSQDRMTQGHFEMIEMGVLTDEAFDPETMATHTLVDGEWLPADCAGLNSAWTLDPNAEDDDVSGAWLLNNGLAIDPPTGGLYGGAGLVNVWKGALHTYEAIAVNGWSTSGKDGLNSNHTYPGSVDPSLNSGDNLVGNVFSDQGVLLKSVGLTRSVDAVSYLFMHDSLMNEYVTDPGLAATTEWVLTFPTKRFYVDTTDAPLAPFTTAWGPYPVPEDEDDPEPLYTACETIALTGLWDREERTSGVAGCEDTNTCPDVIPPIVSPPPPFIPPPNPDGIDPFQLCYETNVIRFGAAGDMGVDLPAETEILGVPLGQYLNFDNTDVFKDQNFKYGWARLELDEYVEDVDDSGEFEEDEFFSRDPLGGLNGLPVVGFAVNRFSNNYLMNDAGEMVLSAYGALFDHRSTRKVGS